VATKLKLFIGSSSENLKYAYGIHESLEHDADCTVWTQGVFGLTRTTLSELLRNLNLFDCAVFIFAPDDRLVVRREKQLAVRDNVIFELGLFCGHLGPERVFVVAPDDIKNMRLPTDLLGVTFATYQSRRNDPNIQAALGSACSKIRRELETLAATGSRVVPAIAKRGFFSDFNAEFPLLFQRSKSVTLYFIHSRRWRENQYDHIVEFLKRRGTRLTVFLPNRRNGILIKAMQTHFEDGPHIPGFINDAFDYFEDLRKLFQTKVRIHRFETYPTYSFYKFDTEFIIAAYPTTPRRRDVPTFRINELHPYAQFVLEDLAQLSKR
jgi:hypothetical protein